ncbi:hypothetical protein CA85_50720 [Allorhodopirellula solitaria]|uniref:Uncharacterized protein n=1 Tax=Allorhodopirellula solitaria TaxID=2527987 RepID=A0A5C5WNF0_9BACT|nr:hypothetical protein CA85_50720 [Allorhodopirellula solitaria]
MADFGLIRSFDIDDHQLDGQSPQECFVLGYELAAVDALLKGNDEFSQLIHSQNRERINVSCAEEDRQFRLEWMQSDPSEGWMMLHVQRR